MSNQIKTIPSIEIRHKSSHQQTAENISRTMLRDFLNLGNDQMERSLQNLRRQYFRNLLLLRKSHNKRELILPHEKIHELYIKNLWLFHHLRNLHLLRLRLVTLYKRLRIVLLPRKKLLKNCNKKRSISRLVWNHSMVNFLLKH